MNRLRTTMFIAAVFMALLLSAMNAVPALADDGLPPAEETSSTEAPPAEEMTAETEPAAQEGEALPPAEETDPASEEQAPPVESILEGLPEDTQLIVVDEEGEALPLASQEAAETLAGGDPMWCPVGVTPGAASCSPSYTRFNDPGTPEIIDSLIEWLLANPKTVAGVIWIESSYSSAEGGNAVELSGFGTTVNYALTLNGGWSGNNNTLLNPNAPSTFTVPLQITWNAPVTIKNIVIEGASGGGVALEVTTPGNITLNNVDAQNNTTNWGGAFLDNSSGAGNVVVNDSTFNGNTGGSALGLEISSRGVVTLKNVSAILNTYEGAYIDNSSALTPKAVTLNGFNNFSLNGGNGLEIYSKGVITLSNVTAIYNNGSGAYLDNCNYNPVTSFCNLGVASGVTIKGVNNFSNNGWDGLRVFSGGAITVSNLTANDNGTDPARSGVTYPDPESYNAYGKGAFLHNYGASTKKPITLSGTNTFNGNASNGLFAFSFGAIKVNNLTANDNGCDPLKDTDDFFCAGAFFEAYLGVAQTGFGTFVNNSSDGLKVFSFGAATFSNLYAAQNGGGGAWIETFGINPYNITLLGANTFNDNDVYGLAAWSNGVVTLNNLTAIGNLWDGVYVNNTDASSPRAVVLKGKNIFNGNGLSGLAVHSYGAITTNNVTAMYNGGTGVLLDNCDEDGFEVCLAYSPQPVTMNGINNISENGSNGLYIESRGAIKVSSLTANYNVTNGAFLINYFDNAAGGVSITGYGIFIGTQQQMGLRVVSAGAVALSNITANENNQFGVDVFNAINPLKPANVTISGVNIFNDNENSGLSILTYGAVTLNNVTANWNGDAVLPNIGYGVAIDNAGGSLPRAVTLNGVNTFIGNYGNGLYVDSLGAIKVSKVTASSNDLSGAFLDNRHGVLNAPITLLGYGVFNDNGDSGLVAVSNGAILTSNVTANNNEFMGVYFDNYSVTAVPVTVTMLGVNTFNSNFVHGLTVLSDGQITLNNITANGNGAWGAFLDNVIQGKLGAPRNILLNGTNNFIGNTNGGLYFDASGSVFLTRVTAALNTDGVVNEFFAYGIWGGADGNITFTCGSLFLNEGFGYYLNAGGVVSLKGVFSYGNDLAPDIALGTSVLITRTCPLP